MPHQTKQRKVTGRPSSFADPEPRRERERPHITIGKPAQPTSQPTSGTSSTASHRIVDEQGFIWHAEIDALKSLVRMLSKNPTIVNIGTGPGTSAIAMLETRSDAFVYSVDHEPCEGGTDNVRKAGLERRWKPITGDSAKVGKNWQHGKVDMVFINGGHAYQVVHADINAWLPHLKKRTGIIAFHDYRPLFAGVWTAVNQLIKGKLNLKELLHVDNLIGFRNVKAIKAVNKTEKGNG